MSGCLESHVFLISFHGIGYNRVIREVKLNFTDEKEFSKPLNTGFKDHVHPGVPVVQVVVCDPGRNVISLAVFLDQDSVDFAVGCGEFVHHLGTSAFCTDAKPRIKLPVRFHMIVKVHFHKPKFLISICIVSH